MEDKQYKREEERGQYKMIHATLDVPGEKHEDENNSEEVAGQLLKEKHSSNGTNGEHSSDNDNNNNSDNNKNNDNDNDNGHGDNGDNGDKRDNGDNGYNGDNANNDYNNFNNDKNKDKIIYEINDNNDNDNDNGDNRHSSSSDSSDSSDGSDNDNGHATHEVETLKQKVTDLEADNEERQRTIEFLIAENESLKDRLAQHELEKKEWEESNIEVEERIKSLLYQIHILTQQKEHSAEPEDDELGSKLLSSQDKIELQDKISEFNFLFTPEEQASSPSGVVDQLSLVVDSVKQLMEQYFQFAVLAIKCDSMLSGFPCNLDASELYDEANNNHLVPVQWPSFILGRLKSTPPPPTSPGSRRSVSFSPNLTHVRTFSALHSVNAPPVAPYGIIPPTTLPSPTPANRPFAFD